MYLRHEALLSVNLATHFRQDEFSAKAERNDVLSGKVFGGISVDAYVGWRIELLRA